jgi:hypothetical protein
MPRMAIAAEFFAEPNLWHTSLFQWYHVHEFLKAVEAFDD